MRKTGLALVGVILSVGLLWGEGFKVRSMHRAGQQGHVPDRVLVKFKTGVKTMDVCKSRGLTIEKSHLTGVKELVVPAGKSVESLVAELSKDPAVEYAEPNYVAYAFMTPDDKHYPLQWHLDNPVYGGIKTASAWDDATGSGVIIGVLDTGVRKGSDLQGTSFVPGYDFAYGDSDPLDEEGHGTHVCGTIAQTTNNSTGTAGVAFDASIMPVQVLDKRGSGSYASIANGIIWATDNGVHIINMSLGGASSSTTLHDAVKYAYESNVVIVCASGNDGMNGVSYPAAYPECIAVGATNYREEVTNYSNYGASLDITAPGGDGDNYNGDQYIDGVLQQTFEKRGSRITWNYYFYTGTSMASPHVAGVAGLVRSCGVTGRQQITDILYTTAEDHGTTGWDEFYGHGIVDAAAAVEKASGPGDITPPDISNVQSGNVAYNSAIITWDTDETADSKVEYGLDPSYGSAATDAAFVTSHAIDLTGLSAETVYHYRVVSKDAAGNETTGNDYAFTTPIKPPDTIPPVISDIEAVDVTKTTAVIIWTTDELANSEVEYGIEGDYGNTVSGATFVTSHSLGLEGLSLGTMYHYRVKSTDAAGNTAVSGDNTFTTLSDRVTDTIKDKVSSRNTTDSWTFDCEAGEIDLCLAWDNTQDLDLYLYGPDQMEVAKSLLSTPEEIHYAASVGGAYRAEVRLNGARLTKYELTITYSPAGGAAGAGCLSSVKSIGTVLRSGAVIRELVAADRGRHDLRVYDAMGREVTGLESIGSGIYFIKAGSGGKLSTKVLVVR
jgi:serine protease